MQETWAAFFNDLDITKDGNLTRGEILQRLTQAQENGEHALLCQIHEDFGNTLSLDNFEQVFEEMDQNHDDRISLAEFRTYLSAEWRRSSKVKIAHEDDLKALDRFLETCNIETKEDIQKLQDRLALVPSEEHELRRRMNKHHDVELESKNRETRPDFALIYPGTQDFDFNETQKKIQRLIHHFKMESGYEGKTKDGDHIFWIQSTHRSLKEYAAHTSYPVLLDELELERQVEKGWKDHGVRPMLSIAYNELATESGITALVTTRNRRSGTGSMVEVNFADRHSLEISVKRTWADVIKTIIKNFNDDIPSDLADELKRIPTVTFEDLPHVVSNEKKHSLETLGIAGGSILSMRVERNPRRLVAFRGVRIEPPVRNQFIFQPDRTTWREIVYQHGKPDHEKDEIEGIMVDGNPVSLDEKLSECGIKSGKIIRIEHEKSAVMEIVKREDQLYRFRQHYTQAVLHAPHVNKWSPFEHIYGPYKLNLEMQHLFYQHDSECPPFGSKDRMFLLNQMVISDRGFALDTALAKREIKCFVPLHDMEKLSYLREAWFGAAAWPWLGISVPPPWTLTFEPLENVRQYFGEKITLYFGFMGWYTSCLMVPSILGMIVFCLQFVGLRSNLILAIYGMGLQVWGFAFLFLWLKEEKTLALKWGMSSFESTEVERPAFQGQVSWDFGGSGRRRILTGFQKLSPPKSLVLFTLIITTGFLVGGVYLMRVLFASDLFKVSDVVAEGISYALTGCLIEFMNGVLRQLAISLVKRENHRTDTQFEDAVIARVFTFEFINSYFPLFYIAFLRPQIESGEECSAFGCLDKLGFCIAMILLVHFAASIFPPLVGQCCSGQTTQQRRSDIKKNIEAQIGLATYDPILGPLQDAEQVNIKFTELNQ